MRRNWYEDDPSPYPFGYDPDLEYPDIRERLSPNVNKRLAALIHLQKQHDELKAKFLKEKATPGDALEAKLEKLLEPLYTKRYEIVNGVVEVEGELHFAVPDPSLGNWGMEKGVPDFWLRALKSHEWFEEQISKQDEEALKFLKDIKGCRINDPNGYKLEFFFDTNPFFKNSVLTKTYHMVNDKWAKNAIGTDIEWYPGKSLREKTVYPPGHKNNPRPRGRFEIPEWKPVKALKIEPKSYTVDCPSFFDFFKSPEVPEDDSDSDSDPVSIFQHLVEDDYELGSEILHKIIPEAVLWFTGEAEDSIDSYMRKHTLKDDTDEDEDDDSEDEYAMYYRSKYYDSEEFYEDEMYEKKSSGPSVTNLPSVPSGSSVVPPTRSTLNPDAPPFIPGLGYGAKKEFNVTTFDSIRSFIPNLGSEKEVSARTFDSISDEDNSDDDEILESMKKKVCQEFHLDSSVSNNSVRNSNSGKGDFFGRKTFSP